MREQFVGAGLAESRNEIAGVQFDLRRNYLCRRFDNVRPLGFADSDNVGRAPFILEPAAANTDALCAFLKFVDQPVAEGIIEILFSYLALLQLLGHVGLTLLSSLSELQGTVESPAGLVDRRWQFVAELLKRTVNCI